MQYLRQKLRSRKAKQYCSLRPCASALRTFPLLATRRLSRRHYSIWIDRKYAGCRPQCLVPILLDMRLARLHILRGDAKIQLHPVSLEEVKMTRRQAMWNALKNITIVISLVVNTILIIALLVIVTQIGNIKATLYSVFNQLDTAFVSLGTANIQEIIRINQMVPVQFDLPIDQQGVAIILRDVPLTIPATFVLGGSGGTINGTVSLALPAGTSLPLRISMTVPVDNEIPVVFDQAISIPLGARGLGPTINELRAVTLPLLELISTLPD